ncbi:MAG: hypothetical protein AVDCRST_MAG07-1152, partial [uncultured Frankineae bacterium]
EPDLGPVVPRRRVHRRLVRPRAGRSGRRRRPGPGARCAGGAGGRRARRRRRPGRRLRSGPTGRARTDVDSRPHGLRDPPRGRLARPGRPGPAGDPARRRGRGPDRVGARRGPQLVAMERRVHQRTV